MKVAILGPLDLEYMGGGETNSMMVANLLSMNGAEVTYFGSGCPLENIPIEHLSEQIRFVYEPSAFRNDPMASPIVLRASSLLSLGLIGMVGKRRLMKIVDDFDMIFFSYPSLLARRIIPYALRNNKRVVLANHGTFFEYFGNSRNPIVRAFKTFGEYFLLKPFAKNSSSIVVHTQTSFQSSIYRELGFKDNCIVEVPQNNVNFSEYAVGRNEGKFHVVFLGRIAKSKGVELLSDVIRANPDVKFSIIGNGPLLKKLMNLTKDTDTEVFGYVSDEEKKNILSLSDAMIVPSIFDSLSIASIEGLASGLPLIISDTAAGPKYIIEKDGLFGTMSERTTHSFTNAIRHYRNIKENDPGRYFQEKIQRREKARNIFDAPAVATELMSGIYRIVNEIESETPVERPSGMFARK